MNMNNGIPFESIENWIKQDFILLMANPDYLNFIENKLYMNGNNDEFILHICPINGGLLVYALIKKIDDLREYFGIEDDKKWEHLIGVFQGDSDLILQHMEGVYDIPSLGKTKSIRLMLNSVFSILGSEDEIRKRCPNFNWNYLPVLYQETEEYQKCWIFPKSKNKRKRTHIPKGLRHEVFKRDNYTCVECGATKEDGAKLHIDHIIPVSKGGSDELDNLQTLCAECNLNKSNLIQNKEF